MKTAYRYQPRHDRISALPPAADKGVRQMDAIELHEKEEAGMSHLARLYRYGAKHGLPNLSSAECMRRLTLLTRTRQEELLLADKIEAELSRPSMLKERDW